jgi:uncharacterized protein YbbC (DUF1343 family)
VPVVHGMTPGEYAGMLNGENWLDGGKRCDLRVVTCMNYDHRTFYELPVKPSPNLPNMRAVYLYPSICLFEGTQVSVGRGTDKQFQVIGAPAFRKGNFSFVPKPAEGAKHPFHEGKICHGYDLTGLKIEDLRKRNFLDLSYLINYYKDYPDKEDFFLVNMFFDKLAGNSQLREMLIAGNSEAEIRKSWEADLAVFKERRKKYLLYKDF